MFKKNSVYDRKKLGITTDLMLRWSKLLCLLLSLNCYCLYKVFERIFLSAAFNSASLFQFCKTVSIGEYDTCHHCSLLSDALLHQI